MIYVAPTAVFVGDVSVADGGSVWHGAVLRGDFDAVEVGRDSNVQDNAVLHVDQGLPCRIGDRVTIGHSAVVHGCTIETDCLIGMNATISSGAKIGRGSLVAAGAVVRESADFPEASVIGGVPAKVLRKVDDVLAKRIELSWSIYRNLAKTSLPARPSMKGDPSKQVKFAMSQEFTRLLQGT
ncbi:MAG TPA: gamma carbonic anhydrase family protein [Thermoplasmata archaeon]|jgi:carbonic anhydrase/acetyltransferase-like protein (isoleucine patch superfamily)